MGLLCAPCAAAVSQPTVTSPTALVVDRCTGNVIYAKNADARVYPASTTKVMTVLLAVEAIESGTAAPEDEVTTSATALQGLSSLGSTAGIREGEVLTLEQLMYCAMVSSANEACNIIAEHISGSVSDFIALMNERAAQLGCTATHFANTHGLPNLDHYTTASDFALIALEATAHPLFMEICNTANAEIPATNKSEKRTLHNSNALICSKSIYGDNWVYDGAYGIKTGHTTAAGYCLASAASRNGVDLLALVFGAATSSTCFRDSTRLYDWAFGNYSYRELLSPADHIGSVPVVTNGEVDYVELCPATNISLLLPNSCDLSEFSREITLNTDSEGMVSGPLTPGAVLGKVRLVKDGTDYGSVDLVPVSAAALIMDRKTGEILYAKGTENRIFPADTTKVMTALLAVEAIESGNISLNDLVTVSDTMNTGLTNAATRCGFRDGQMLTLETLLYYMLLTSGDDAANLIAEYVSGSVPAFVAQMNERAAQLGCTNTNFTSPTGLFDENHYTTVQDISAIALEASRHALFMRICGAPVFEIPGEDGSESTVLRNTNALVCDESVYGRGWLYDGASGMKTGYNESAGYCLVSTAERDGVELLCAVFGGVKDGSDYSCFSESISLYDWVYENFSYLEVLKSTENLASVDVSLGSNSDYVNLRPTASITALLPNDYDPDEFTKNIRVYALENNAALTAPISAGEVLGEVTLMRGDRVYGTVKLVASASVDLSRMQYIKSQILETTRGTTFRVFTAVIVLLFAAYLAWVIIYRCKRIKYVRASAAAARPEPPAPQSAPQEPQISFFRSTASREQSAPAVDTARPDPAPVTVFRPEQPAAPAAPAKPAVPAPPQPETDPLLKQAVCVAQLPPEPAAPQPTPAAPAAPAAPAEAPTASAPPTPVKPQEDTDRDYFEEFFRPKK